jgi:hypothetical protein
MEEIFCGVGLGSPVKRRKHRYLFQKERARPRQRGAPLPLYPDHGNKGLRKKTMKAKELL